LKNYLEKKNWIFFMLPLVFSYKWIFSHRWIWNELDVDVDVEMKWSE
jgi:hypothetical protein